MKYDRAALKRILKQKGLTFQEAAKVSRITRNNVRFLEAGVTIPKADTLAKLATALGVSVGEFFKGEDAA